MKLVIDYFYDKNARGHQYRSYFTEKPAGEVLTFRHPGGQVQFKVPDTAGNHTLTATTEPDGGPVRVIAQIEVKE